MAFRPGTAARAPTNSGAVTALGPVELARAILIVDSAASAAARTRAMCSPLQWQPWPASAAATDATVASAPVNGAAWVWSTVPAPSVSPSFLSSDEAAAITAAVAPLLPLPPVPPSSLSANAESALTAAAAALPLPLSHPLPPTPAPAASAPAALLARARAWAARTVRAAGRLRVIPPALAQWATGDAEAEANPYCGARGAGPEWGAGPGEVTMGLEGLVAYIRSPGPVACGLDSAEKQLLVTAAATEAGLQWTQERRDAATLLSSSASDPAALAPAPGSSFVAAAAAVAAATAAARLSEVHSTGLALALGLSEAAEAWGDLAAARAAAVTSAAAADVCARASTKTKALKQACARGPLALVCVGGTGDSHIAHGAVASTQAGEGAGVGADAEAPNPVHDEL